MALLRIAKGYIFACAAVAAGILLIGSVVALFSRSGEFHFERIFENFLAFLLVWLVMSFGVFVINILQFMFFVAICEIFKKQGLVYYLAGGLLVCLTVYAMFDMKLPLWFLIPCGIGGSFIYWWFSGQYAGQGWQLASEQTASQFLAQRRLEEGDNHLSSDTGE